MNLVTRPRSDGVVFVGAVGPRRAALVKQPALEGRLGLAGSRQQTAGLTLIELMAALAFFGIMGVAFTSLSMSTVWANHEARRVTAAANLARDMIEELRAADFAAVTTGSDSSAMSESGGSGSAAAD